jgi:MinD-like ATPase involved in chromosome partitioning or flagellar assembly
MDKENAPTQTGCRNGSKQYKQLKVSVNQTIVSNFKNACAASNVSMAVKLSEFMADYSNTMVDGQPVHDYSTKRQRRSAIKKIVKQLEQVRDCEQDYSDRIPENLQNSSVYNRAEEFLEYVDAAIDALVSIDSI